MLIRRHKLGFRVDGCTTVFPSFRQAERQLGAMIVAAHRADVNDRQKQRQAARLLRASARAEKRFERDLVRVMGGVHAGVRELVRGELPSDHPALERRHDAGPKFPRDYLQKLFVYVQRPVRKAFDVMAKVVDEDNEEALRLFGISPAYVPGLAGILAHAREAAVRRVQGAARKYASQVQGILDDPANVGLRVEDLAELLEERAAVSTSAAAFIARDTTLRTNAAITKTRQQAAGVTEYRWSTSRDERVRPLHAELEGERFSYDDPPETTDTGETNNPGEDFQCRCIGLPVLSELEEPAPEEGEEETAA